MVVAFSFTPESVSRRFEHKVPALSRRIEAVAALQQRGWPIGLRFDPLIYQPGFEQQYRDLFKQVFERVQAARVHSVSLGSFRLPRQYYDKVMRLYPDEALFRGPLERTADLVSYRPDLDQAMHAFCRAELRRYLSAEQLFVCSPEPGPVPRLIGASRPGMVGGALQTGISR
jgi:spore photoproduct lyase